MSLLNRTPGTEAAELVLDPIGCQGHGTCAELLPELIHVDEWGYPVLTDRRVPAPLMAHARRAVAACPVLALRLTPGR